MCLPHSLMVLKTEILRGIFKFWTNLLSGSTMTLSRYFEYVQYTTRIQHDLWRALVPDITCV